MSKSQTGRKHSLETREKMSKRQKGEANISWKGGVTPLNKKLRRSLDFKIWRQVVFQRDNYKCVKCGLKSNKLHPHHIKNFSNHPEIRFNIENGITLCSEDHILFHTRYGNQDNNLLQIKDFLKEEVQQ